MAVILDTAVALLKLFRNDLGALQSYFARLGATEF